MTQLNIAIIGAGIAGLSVASLLAERARVTVLEMESQPAYHSSGRSAAAYIEPYISHAVMHLTQISRGFFERPPNGFCEAPLVKPRGGLTLATADQHGLLDDFLRNWHDFCPHIHEIDLADAFRLVPVLRRDYVSRVLLDPVTMDLDVHELISSHRRRLLALGGRLLTNERVMALESSRAGGVCWRVGCASGNEVQADVVVIAAGAWTEQLALLAGAKPLGLVPKRRTACLIDPPAGQAASAWPIVHGVDNSFYFRPESGRLMVSPADATPSEPCDAQPDEFDIAVAIDRVQQAADLPVRSIAHKWAGLRSFVADNAPVAGFDDSVEGLFWLCGQGGVGVQTSPAMARYAASLILQDALPVEFSERGIEFSTLAPQRLRRVAVAAH